MDRITTNAEMGRGTANAEMARSTALNKIKKFIKKRIYRRRTANSHLCEVFDTHYIFHKLQFLIPIEEIYAHPDYPIPFYSGRYFSRMQINCQCHIFSLRNPTCRFRGQDYCKLFGYGDRGHGDYSCIGWCGSESPRKCYQVRKREAIIKIALAIKRWVKKRHFIKRRLEFIIFSSAVKKLSSTNTPAPTQEPTPGEKSTKYVCTIPRFSWQIASFIR